ncbi:PKD domain-containing protein [Mangrovivirga sp. M17]|uniref:PKD domain-containing protein n=1 Tax=Mangrovivirga halotolerans TaxID=2993936 RepID=A0ABT3RSX9_9BACT|nr:T9SS type A sorting domain-containing protein [Mangrovivirga halotolerans]MCX2744459.1 PKD domain-containing protein [Mangrovivirga halotolerans]
MKNLYILILLGLLIAFSGKSQYPTINWQKIDGGSYSDYPYTVIRLSDSSYLTVGFTISAGGNKNGTGFGPTYGWVVKHDKQGTTVWKKSYGGNSHDRIYDAIALPEGGALLLSSSSSMQFSGNKTAPNKGGLDYWLLKIDNNGNIIWQKTYGGINTDFATSIASSADGNFYISGYSLSPISGDKSQNLKGFYDYWILKIDPLGNKIWDKTIGGNSNDLPTKVIGNYDGGCTIAGISSSPNSGDKSEPSIKGYNYWIVRLDDNGNIIWENTLRSLNTYSNNTGLIEINNSIYVLGTTSGPAGYDKTVGNNRRYDYWLINLSKQTGNQIWQKLYGGDDNELLNAIIKTSNNEILLKGHSLSNISGDKTEPRRGGYDLWLLKIDSSGNIIWDKTLGGSGNETPLTFEKGLISDSQGNLTLSAATTFSIGGDHSFPGYGLYDYWTIQLKDNIIDNTPPTIITKDITIQLDLLGHATITPQDIDNGTSDPSGIALLEIDINNFDCSNVGPNTVILTAIDNRGNSASAPAIVTVVDNIPPTVLTKNVTLNLDVTGNASLAPIDLDNGSTDACGIALFQSKENFTCADIGENIINLAVTDVNGNIAKGQATVTVINDNPIINSLSLPINPNPIETQINASATITDDNIVEAEFNWGDGTSSLGTLTGNDVSGEHSYPIPGVYEISLTITDVCGQTDTEIFQYVVIYDPYGGFVTGGGYIWSHPGYYTPDPLAEGKANFGFVAKYKKGATTPTGNTQFKFTAGNLNFHSTEYEWLVIAGQKAMYKGSGTINGFGNYKFMLSAIDGTTKADGDRFRMQIWDMSDNIIYDNQPEDDENADAATYLGGGSITIHDGNTKGGTSMAEIIADDLNSESIKFYPNPVISTMNIQLTKKFIQGDQSLEIEIFETNGRSVELREYSDISSEKIQLQLEYLNKGIYLMTLRKGEFLEYFRFIKE